MYAKNPLTYLIAFLFIVFFTTDIFINTEQQFVLLAKSFLNNQITLDPTNNIISDLALYQGKYYWPLGPLPAVLLTPFVFFSKDFLQGYLSFPLSLLSFYLLYKIAGRLQVGHQKSLFLAVFFIFGSVYTPLAMLPISWFFAQVVACTLLLLAIYEFTGKRRYGLIGPCIALCVATRLNLILASLFFLYFILKSPKTLQNLLKFTLPIITSLALIGIYNFNRFQTPFESGYNLQLVPQEADVRRSIGLFSIAHIPSNLFYMLLKGPEPVLNSAHELRSPFVSFDTYGLSLFILSPVLFLLFKVNLKKELVAASSLVSLALLIPIITYYGIGQSQVGFRYALDFYPFIYLLVIDATKKTGIKSLASLVLLGVFTSMYFTFMYLYHQQVS